MVAMPARGVIVAPAGKGEGMSLSTFRRGMRPGAGIAVDHIATHKILAVRPGMYSELKLGTQTRVTWLFAFLQRSAADMKASFR